MIFIISSQVRLKVKVSINIIYFPGCYNKEDYFIWLPNFTYKDMFLSLIISSLKSYNFPRILLIVMTPLDCFNIFFFFYGGFESLSGLSPFFCSYSSWSSSLLLKKASAWNSITPIYLFWNFIMVVKGSFLLTLISLLKFKSKIADILSFPNSRSSRSFLPTLDLNVFFSENIDSENELSVW